MKHDQLNKHPESYWKKKLSNEEYEVCRKRGTEPPFSGKFYKFFENGVYKCVCCGQVLFDSNTKYESGSGWPSFWDAYDSENISLHQDNEQNLNRIEVRCKKCESHLGHVFDDGPSPSKKRYCINSISLKFERDN